MGASPAQSGTEAMPPSYAPRDRRRSNGPVPAEQHSARKSQQPRRAVREPYGDVERRTDDQRPPREPEAPRKTKRRRRRWIPLVLIPVLLLATVLGWGGYLYFMGNGRLDRVDALSGAADTPGTTYLIVGSDERTAFPTSTTEGMRADTIMLLHKPESGSTSLVSLPRDTYVVYPDGHGEGKLNGALNIGDQQLLVRTVENLTGLTIDHYIQVGMEGVQELTDAVGGIELCYDFDVNDSYSKLNWEAGCHTVDGETALAFSRMRYSDPLGDIGRTERQRQVVSKVIGKAISRDVLLSPGAQKDLVESVADVITVDEQDSLWTVGMAGLTLRGVMGTDGLKGSPPIASMDYRVAGQSTVLLDPNTIDQFWADLRDGTLTSDSFASF